MGGLVGGWGGYFEKKESQKSIFDRKMFTCITHVIKSYLLEKKENQKKIRTKSRKRKEIKENQRKSKQSASTPFEEKNTRYVVLKNKTLLYCIPSCTTPVRPLYESCTTRVDLHVDVRVDVHVDIRVDVNVDVHVDVRVDVRVGAV